MALSLRKIKRLYLMPRKEREGEGSPLITSTKIRDQVLPQIRRNKRRIYLRSNATGARNTVSMPVAVEVLTKGSMKLQLLMLKKALLTRSQGMMIVQSSFSSTLQTTEMIWRSRLWWSSSKHMKINGLWQWEPTHKTIKDKYLILHALVD